MGGVLDEPNRSSPALLMSCRIGFMSSSLEISIFRRVLNAHALRPASSGVKPGHEPFGDLVDVIQQQRAAAEQRDIVPCGDALTGARDEQAVLVRPDGTVLGRPLYVRRVQTSRTRARPAIARTNPYGRQGPPPSRPARTATNDLPQHCTSSTERRARACARHVP